MSEQDDGITQVLSSGNFIMEDILGSPNFQQSLKQETPELIKYLTNEKTIKEMAAYLFSVEKSKEPLFKQLSTNILKVFTCCIPRIFVVFLESKGFAEILYSFLGSNDSSDETLCGFLYTILSQQIRWGNPKFFKMYTDVGDMLFARMTNLAIQELIVIVAARPSLHLFSDRPVVLYLSTIATCGTETSRAAVSVLLQLFDTLSDESPLMEEFFEKEVVENLFKICCESDSPVIQNDIAQVLEALHSLNCNLSPFLTTYADRLVLRPGNINYLSVGFLPILKPHFLDIFSLFFEPNACKCLHNYCSALILKLSPDDINSLAEDSDFVRKLIAAHGTPQWCPHALQISLVLARLTFECDGLHFAEWEGFVRDNIVSKMKILEEDYGGHLDADSDESDASDFDSSSDSDYSYYSYEEDEADIGQNEEMDSSDEENSSDKCIDNKAAGGGNPRLSDSSSTEESD